MDFQPTSASPQLPRRPLNKHLPQNRPLQAQTSVDTSYSSTTSVLSLAALSPKDVEIIDSIISRAPDSATSFLAVFKAYNDVLQERGMDAGQDVVYYRFLLKLGVLRGTWGERWRSLKNAGQDRSLDLHDHSHDDDDATTTEAEEQRQEPITPRPLSSRPLPSSIARNLLKPSVPASAPHTRLRGQGNVKSNPITVVRPPNPPSSRGTVEPGTIPRGSSSSPSVGPPSYRTYPPEPVEHAKTPTAPLLARLERLGREKTSSGPAAPLSRVERTPALSSRARSREPVPPKTDPPAPRTLAKFAEAAARTGKIKLPTVTAASKRQPNINSDPTNGGINAEETWKVLRMEGEADDFRLYALVKRSWDVWVHAIEWYQRRAEQVEQAHYQIISRHALGVWSTRSKHYVDLARRADNVSHTLLRRTSWKVWRAAFSEKRRKRWQDDMKKRLGIVRVKMERRTMAEAFTTWYHRHQEILADKHLRVGLIRRVVRLWRARLSYVDNITDTADQVVETRQRMAMEQFLEKWKRQAQLKKLERSFQERAHHGVLIKAWNIWRENGEYNRLAQQERRYWLLKTSLRKMKRKVDQAKALERRANHYIHRQELILVRAVLRVWTAKERGALLERVHRSRTVATAFSQWKSRMQGLRSLQGRSVLLTAERDRQLLGRVVSRWKRNIEFQITAGSIAEQHRGLQLAATALGTWRARMIENGRSIKQARAARKWFVMRDAMRRWNSLAAEKKRQRKLKDYELGFVSKVFKGWHAVAQQHRHNRFLVLAFQEKIEIRIMHQALSHWLDSVVDRKSLELQVSEERNAVIVRGAFEKWKGVLQRHRDEMNLMQSYHDVKRDDLIRRTFLRWSSLSRKSVQRKRRLEQYQEEQKQMVIARAWDQWRDRFKERELAWLERQVRLQLDYNVLFRSFRVWESKTMSVPALRFFSLNIKAKAWNMWRDALPRARKEREARDMDRVRLLSRILYRWKEAYKGKIQLKSIARARHLRLPVVPTPKPTYRRPSAGATTRPSAIARVAASTTPPQPPPQQPMVRSKSPERRSRRGSPPRRPSPPSETSSEDVVLTQPIARTRSFKSENRPVFPAGRPIRSGTTPLPTLGGIPRSNRPAPVSEAGAARLRRAQDDDESDTQSAKTSPGKGISAITRRAKVLANDDSPSASRDRLRLELRAAASRRTAR